MAVDVCKRTGRRFPLPEDARATVDFVYPYPQGRHCSMRLRDISESGLSFFLMHELPGLDVGDSLDRVSVDIEGYDLRGDLLVMHLTPDSGEGSVCGALFYPRGDRNIRALHALVAELEENEGSY